MAKNPASFQKRQRELDKKRKAEDKRKRREQQKNAPRPTEVSDPPHEPENTESID
jgi:hypothetical protein